MTNKRWSAEEWDAVRKLQSQNGWEGMVNAYESQKKDYEECNDPVQKARYLRGLKILERNFKNRVVDTR